MTFCPSRGGYNGSFNGKLTSGLCVIRINMRYEPLYHKVKCLHDKKYAFIFGFRFSPRGVFDAKS